MDSLKPNKIVHEPLVDRRDPDHYLEERIDSTEPIGEQAAREGVEQLLSSLNPGNALVIRLRFGMLDHPSVAALGISADDKEPFTIERIAKLLNMSLAGIQKRERKALLIMTRKSKRETLTALFGRDLPDGLDWKEIKKLSHKYYKKSTEPDQKTIAE
ncbi:MAG: hypothetical protein AAB665_00840 [Patescibacteria group bacterium]